MGASTVLFDLTTANGGVVLSMGAVKMSISADITGGLGLGKIGEWDLILIDPSGKRNYKVYGTVTTADSVTQG